MSSLLKRRPSARLRTVLLASGAAFAVVAAGAWIILNGGSGASDTARAAQSAPRAATPLADAQQTAERPATRVQHAKPRPKKAAKKPKHKPKKPRTPRVVRTGSCQASYYGEGQMTASGESFNPSEMTAAHKTLRFGTRVRVTNKNNGRTVTVRINDRGPFISGRCLDLSTAAMRAVGGTSAGVIPVRYEVLARH